MVATLLEGLRNALSAQSTRLTCEPAPPSFSPPSIPLGAEGFTHTPPSDTTDDSAAADSAEERAARSRLTRAALQSTDEISKLVRAHARLFAMQAHLHPQIPFHTSATLPSP
jgi:hypothetical protein